MKKFLTIVMVAVVIIGVYMMFKPNYYTKMENVNKESYVSYEYVNVRKTPNGGKIGQLEQNEKVVLTGNVCEMNTGSSEEVFDMWFEIDYNGELAWITADAVR